MLIGYIIVFILGVWSGVLGMMAAYLIREDRRHRDVKEATDHDL